MKSPIQCHSALRNIDSEEIIDINDAKGLGKVFYCPYCKGEMIPRCGKHNEWHFAHKRSECSYDKYLHSLAELKILKWIRESETISLSLPYKSACSESVRCGFYKRETCAIDDNNDFNLKDFFGQCEKEKEIRIGEKSFVPDILWHCKINESKPLFIEIFVTHPCEKEKIESGAHIIEFCIKSENDIDRIIGSTIQESERVRLYNFKPLEDVVGDKPCGPVYLHKYTIFPSHKTFLDFHITCRYVPSLSDLYKSYTLRRGFFEMTYRNEYDAQIHNEGGMEVMGLAYASQYDKSLKHCWLCTNQTNSDGFTICKLLKERSSRILNKDAYKCPDFQRNEDIINEKIEILNQYRQTHYVDVWVDNAQVLT